MAAGSRSAFSTSQLDCRLALPWLHQPSHPSPELVPAPGYMQVLAVLRYGHFELRLYPRLAYDALLNVTPATPEAAAALAAAGVLPGPRGLALMTLSPALGLVPRRLNIQPLVSQHQQVAVVYNVDHALAASAAEVLAAEVGGAEVPAAAAELEAAEAEEEEMVAAAMDAAAGEGEEGDGGEEGSAGGGEGGEDEEPEEEPATGVCRGLAASASLAHQPGLSCRRQDAGTTACFLLLWVGLSLFFGSGMALLPCEMQVMCGEARGRKRG